MLWQNLAIDITAVPLEQLNVYTAVEYFLCHESQPSENALPLQQVQHYLQAFTHLCDVEDWQRAVLILMVVPDHQSDEELHHQLGLWGYYAEQENLYNALLSKIDFPIDTICYNGLGNIADSRGELDKATHYHQQHLELSKELGDRQGEWMALTGLGNVEKSRGRWKEATTYYRQALNVLEDGQDFAKFTQSRAMLLGNLANVSRYDKPDEALKLATSALEQFQTLNRPSLMARTLVLIGDIYNTLEQPELALNYHQQGLHLARTCNDPVSESEALKGMGEAQFQMNNPQAAKDWYEQSYKRAKSIGERSSEGQALRGLGLAAYELLAYEESKAYFQEYLELASSVGDRWGILGAMQGLSYACDALDDINGAILWETMALKLSESMGDEAEAARSQAYLGYAYLNVENYEMARSYLLTALAWQQKHGEFAQLAMTYYNLTATYDGLGESQKASQCYQKGLKLARQYQPDLVAVFRDLRHPNRSQF